MRRFVVALFAALLLTTAVFGRADTRGTDLQGAAAIRVLYFWSEDCDHCRTVIEEVLKPLQTQYGDQLDVRMLEIGDPENYELLVRTEEYFELAPEDRGIPTLVVGGQILIGQNEIRDDLPCLLENCLSAGGTTWPPIPGLEEALEGTGGHPLDPGEGLSPGGAEVIAPCPEEDAVCLEPERIWAAYFYQVGCQECSRAEADIEYVRTRYPQLVVEEFNIYDDLPLAEWLARRAGRDDVHSPAFFVGQDALIGEREITSQNLVALVEEYASTGAEKVWQEANLSRPLRVPSVLTVLLAGLVDGLNPCAFATLIFFVSYLAASGRQGREVLLAGGAFTLGVFLAYIAVGLGLYRLLDVVQSEVPFAAQISRVVYGLTALLCVGLAVFSFLDYLKARRGQIQDMSLSLPARLRDRVRHVIRAGQRARSYVLAMFATGLIISLLELACTGQIYLPTIIYMTSEPGLRARGAVFLLLYNLAFVVPLVAVFVLTYFGTTSLQLGLFLRRRAATVKLVTTLVFASLAVWLGISLVVG
jgi:cytochrome c biogenesis protein CcdA